MRLQTILPTALALGLVLTGCANQSANALPGTANPAPHTQTLRTCGLFCKPPQKLNVALPGDAIGVYSHDPYDPSHSYQRAFTTAPLALPPAIIYPPTFNPSNGEGYVLDVDRVNIYASASLMYASSPTPSSTVVLAGQPNGFAKLVFDGLHLVLLGFADATASNIFDVTTFDASKTSGTEYALGTIGADIPAPAVGFPTDIAADPVTHTVYISDWLTQDIFVFSAASGALSDSSSPVCEISPPAKGISSPKITHIAYNGANHLLYALLNTGEVEAFQGCSSVPVRDVTGLVSPSAAAYPWNWATDLAADPVSGIVSVAAFTSKGTVTVKSFGPADTGAVAADSFQVSTNAVHISYGP